MSNRKSQPNLNLSGFSPISLNKSISYTKSPAKEYGITQRLEDIREKLIAGFGRWMLAKSNGAQIVEGIHSLKERARASGANAYPNELEAYCNKLKVCKTVMEDVRNDTDKFLREIEGSIAILRSTVANDELESKLLGVKSFIKRVLESYDYELATKSGILENIAHASSSLESHYLIASWSCSANTIDCLFLQLKLSPPDAQWSIGS